ncbi:hypothetical protein Trydic_g11776 [Trypoxylus dichotomus]
MQYLKRFNWFLYFSASIVNLTSLTCGIAFAWSSPMLPKLQSTSDNPLDHPLMEDEISWVASLLSLGAIVGPYAAGYLADTIGRKKTLIISAVPTIASFFILAFAKNLYLYYVARFVLGLTSIGTPLTIVPMFIGEFAELHNRGTLGCFTVLYVSLGFLFSFTIGPYVTFQTFNLLCSIAPTTFLIIFTLFIPETPTYLIAKDNLEEAKKSLVKIRMGPVDHELLTMERSVKSYLASKGGLGDILRTRSLLKASFVSMSLMVIQQLTAMTVVTFYLQFIFEIANSTISPDVAVIIIGVVQFFGALASALVVDKLVIGSSKSKGRIIVRPDSSFLHIKHYYPRRSFDEITMQCLKQINWFLYFSGCVVNLISFTTGVSFAWSSPMLPKLKTTEDNPLGYALSEDEVSWVASLLALGAIIAPFAAGYLADHIGRKKTLIISAIPTIACFLILAFVKNLYLYYVARFVLGLTSVGTPLTIVPMFIGEFAELHNRGTLGGFTILYVSLGFLFSFAVGPFTSFQTFNLLCLIAPVTFLIIFTLFVPETPGYLIAKDNLEEAKKALAKIRIGPVDKEILIMESTVKSYLASKGGIRDILKTKSLLKAACVSMGLMITQQLTAISVMTFYLQFIFESANSNIAPNIATIIIGVVQLFGSLSSTLIVDKVGRRPLLLSSTIITCLSLLVLSIYFYLLIHLDDASNIGWLPIITLVIYRLAYGIGIGSLAQTILSEIFPPHVKSVASSLTVCSCFVFSFGTSKIFPLLVSAVDNWFAFLLFAVCNAAGIIFIWIMVPETKGKTLDEIVRAFE